MAHPLTQYPPSTLPFPSAPRPSPLGFGFGLPSTASSSGFGFGSPSKGSYNPSTGSSSLGFGFASPAAASSSFNPSHTPGGGGGSSSFGSPKRANNIGTNRPGPSPSSLTYRSATAPTLKRARRSLSPDSASGSAGSSPKKVKDELGVGALGPGDDERKVVRKEIKRRKEAVEGKTSGGSGSGVDVGVLLAALPPSAHLNILLNLLTAHPELATEILDKIPQPELNECLHQLEKQLEKIKKGVGLSTIQLNPERIWTRVSKDVEAYTRIASTYLSFITSPPQSRSPPDPQALQSLLYALSTQITFILRLIPAGANTNTRPSGTLLTLGKTVITSWTSWLNAVSSEVNQRSGMFPRSTVQIWSANLDTLANATQQQSSTFGGAGGGDGGFGAAGGGGWTFPQPTTTPTPPHPLVDSFKSAMGPIRDRFVLEMGWLIGRQPVQAFSSASGSWGQGGGGGTASVGGLAAQAESEDEDL